MTRRLIGVYSDPAEPSPAVLWAAFESLLPVRFCLAQDSPEFACADGFIVSSENEAGLKAALTSGKRCYVIQAAPVGMGGVMQGDVRFAPHVHLDGRLRGRTLSHNAITGLGSLTPETEDIILAHHGEQVVWVRSGTLAAPVDYVSAPLPRFREGEFPFDYLNGGHFLQLLPLLHWLREMVGELGWQPPPPRACLMFDDPNLHWPSYGFLPFQETAALAERANFHVACAMVPLDGWFIHRPTADIFRKHANRLSLLTHGNSHLRDEFGSAADERANQRRLAQALRRVDRMERRTGLRVSRVMVPPHEACHPHALGAMSELGFEGACISPWSLRNWGSGRVWPSTFGLEMAELMNGRFPVPPRFKMYAACEGWVVINAFLNRPIVPVGHHDTLVDGIDLLRHVGDMVNSLGDVIWGSMESILRSNYYSRRIDSVLEVLPYSSCLNVVIPEGVDSLAIAASPLEAPVTAWQMGRAKPRPGDLSAQRGRLISVHPGEVIRIRLDGWGSVDYRTIPAPAPSIWPWARRFLCEAQDRLRSALSGPAKQRRQSRAAQTAISSP